MTESTITPEAAAREFIDCGESGSWAPALLITGRAWDANQCAKFLRLVETQGSRRLAACVSRDVLIRGSFDIRHDKHDPFFLMVDADEICALVQKTHPEQAQIGRYVAAGRIAAGAIKVGREDLFKACLCKREPGGRSFLTILLINMPQNNDAISRAIRYCCCALKTDQYFEVLLTEN